jgi:hypothetical protein
MNHGNIGEDRPTIDRLRELARHLKTRPFAPSMVGYELVDGLYAAISLLERREGPSVSPDCDPGSDAIKPPITLLALLRTVPNESEVKP